MFHVEQFLFYDPIGLYLSTHKHQQHIDVTW